MNWRKRILTATLLAPIVIVICFFMTYALIGVAFGFEMFWFVRFPASLDRYNAKKGEIASAIGIVARSRGYRVLDPDSDPSVGKVPRRFDLLGNLPKTEDLWISIVISDESNESDDAAVSSVGSMQVGGVLGDGPERAHWLYFVRIPRNNIREDTEAVAQAMRSVLEEQ
jgi:hypothetical protein